MGQGLVMVGVCTCTDDDVGEHAGLLFAWTSIGCGLMLISQYINDKLLVRGLNNTSALLDDNIAVGVMEAGSFIATGVVMYSTMGGSGGDFAEDLGVTVLYWALAQLLMLGFTVIYRFMTVFDDLEQIKKGNAAAGVSAAMTLISLAFGIGAPIRMYTSVAVFVPVSLVGLVILVALRVIVDKVDANLA